MVVLHGSRQYGDQCLFMTTSQKKTAYAFVRRPRRRPWAGNGFSPGWPMWQAFISIDGRTPFLCCASRNEGCGLRPQRPQRAQFLSGFTIGIFNRTAFSAALNCSHVLCRTQENRPAPARTKTDDHFTTGRTTSHPKNAEEPIKWMWLNSLRRCLKLTVLF
jgi:hypothetical protein